MVDDTLGISKCGNSAVKLNSTINAFIETQRQVLSEEKSVVIHMGNKSKCNTPCPKLKVHKATMHEAGSVKYLGNIVTSHGGIHETIEDRRNKGWGKVAVIQGILSEVDMGSRRLEVGLLVRKAILCSSLLFTAETWSGLKETQLKRLEQVDESLLRSLIKCHSKTAVEFIHMECGTLKLRHILTLNRMMYHHHLLTTDESETIVKIYLKQKYSPTKGDWYELLQQDFKFVGLNITDDEIRSMSRQDYKKKIKPLIHKAAFKYFLLQKQGHSKLNEVNYRQLETQPYLKDPRFSLEERKLLTALRSRCYSAKTNFKKLYKPDLKCRLGCNSPEDQILIFTQCQYIEVPLNIVYGDIFEDTDKQKYIISSFIKIDQRRQKLIENIPPGEARACAQRA